MVTPLELLSKLSRSSRASPITSLWNCRVSKPKGRGPSTVGLSLHGSETVRVGVPPPRPLDPLSSPPSCFP
jgi:hypothetical protein